MKESLKLMAVAVVAIAFLGGCGSKKQGGQMPQAQVKQQVDESQVMVEKLDQLESVMDVINRPAIITVASKDQFHKLMDRYKNAGLLPQAHKVIVVLGPRASDRMMRDAESWLSKRDRDLYISVIRIASEEAAEKIAREHFSDESFFTSARWGDRWNREDPRAVKAIFIHTQNKDRTERILSNFIDVQSLLDHSSIKTCGGSTCDVLSKMIRQ